MKIANAALQKTVLEAALSYRTLGLSVVPVKGKRASVAWKQWTNEKPSHAQISTWARGNKLDGVAVVCGMVSGNLVVLDLDGAEAVADFRWSFPTLASSTYAVATGSGNGEHYYFLVDDPTKTTISPGYELRSDGAYVVAPPSVHPKTCKSYTPLNDNRVAKVWNLDDVVSWIHSKRPPTSPAAPAPSPSSPPPRPRYGSNRLYLWADRGVERQLERLSSTHINVNTQLFTTSMILARMFANPDFGLSEVNLKARLAAAAIHLTRRDGISATLRTIESGWNAGISRGPQPTPELD